MEQFKVDGWHIQIDRKPNVPQFYAINLELGVSFQGDMSKIKFNFSGLLEQLINRPDVDLEKQISDKRVELSILQEKEIQLYQWVNKYRTNNELGIVDNAEFQIVKDNYASVLKKFEDTEKELAILIESR